MRAAVGTRKNPAMTSPAAAGPQPPEVRDATAADAAAIAAVAIATGQDEEWSGSDPAYVRYLMAAGRVVVAVRDGQVTGFGATRQPGAAPAAPVMLCDLFVDPRAHGGGTGRAILAALFAGTGPRMTFSSLHSMALPLYTSFGLDAWWPLLYLSGDARALAMPAGWSAEAATAAQVSDLEREWAGNGRAADYSAWAGRPGAQALVARRNGRVAAAGIAAGDAGTFGLTHLALAPEQEPAGPQDARDAVLAALAWLGRGGTTLARAWLPGPHPAVRALLAAGWRTGEFDLFMATDPDLLDPRRAVPSPALP
jgi:GNAT superfamily N-acetyltransferase